MWLTFQVDETVNQAEEIEFHAFLVFSANNVQ